MSELETLLEAVEKIAKRPVIPADVALWDASHVAAYLCVGKRQVLERYALMPDWPRAHRFPTPSGGRGDPKWPACEVIAWATKYRDKN